LKPISSTKLSTQDIFMITYDQEMCKFRKKEFFIMSNFSCLMFTLTAFWKTMMYLVKIVSSQHLVNL